MRASTLRAICRSPAEHCVRGRGDLGVGVDALGLREEVPGGEAAPTVVDLKIKGNLLTQAQADSDPQAGIYLAGRWLEDYSADELLFAEIAKPGKRHKRMGSSLVSTTRRTVSCAACSRG